jgi:hypothetical protein
MKAIQGFAQRYGFLDHASLLMDREERVVTWGESLWLWLDELAEFRALCSAAGLAADAETGGERERRRLDDAVRQARIGSPQLENPLQYVTPGRRASAVALKVVREEVRSHAAIEVAPLEVSHPIRIRPTSLLAAMYLDLAMELSGNLGARFRTCDQCGKVMRATRRDKRFCSETCRSNARHARKNADRRENT